MLVQYIVVPLRILRM